MEKRKNKKKEKLSGDDLTEKKRYKKAKKKTLGNYREA